LGLLGIGVLVIASVVFYNWWQERSIRRDMVRRFDGPIDDVLMGGEAAAESASGAETTSAAMYEEAEQEEEYATEVEEELAPGDVEREDIEDEAEWDEPEFTVSDEEEAEPELDEEAEEAGFEKAILLQEEDIADEVEPDMPVPPQEQPEQPDAVVAQTVAANASPLPNSVDTLIDEIVTLTPEMPCSGKEIVATLSATPDFGKPVRWYGVSQGAWLPIANDNTNLEFSRIVAALQLADRAGAIQAKNWKEFQEQIESLSQKIDSEVLWQTDRDAVAYAQALDEFCIAVDVTVTLHLTAGISGPFAGTKLRSLMEASGLTLGEDGRFHFANDSGESLFTVCSSDQQPLTEEGLRTSQLADVLLMLDVPRVSDAGNVFKQMAMLGNRMELALNAKLTDARQRTLGDAEIEQIRSQLRAIHAKMQERQLIPGSASVLRLFS
jgi:hypothetical protein